MHDNTELKDFLAKILLRLDEVSEENARLRIEVDVMKRHLDTFLKPRFPGPSPRNPNPPPRYPGLPPDVPPPWDPSFPNPSWL